LEGHHHKFHGGQGVVCRAKMKASRLLTSNSTFFAVKAVETVDKRKRTRVAEEIRLLQKCNHPNILELEEAYVIV
jgi:hypothetical protein